MIIMGLTKEWKTSSRSGNNGACVETKRDELAVQVRDSKDRSGPQLAFSGAAWAGFLGALGADTIR